MNNVSFFNYGEVVRLKKDLVNANLKAGDYGMVWAVYASYVDENQTTLEFDYEGTFWNNEVNYNDAMFYEEDAEKVLIIENVPFSEDMKKLWLYLNQKKGLGE